MQVNVTIGLRFGGFIGSSKARDQDIKRFERTRACRSGLQDSIALGAYRICRNASGRRAGRASWRTARHRRIQ
jgi:hypothetical protein